MLKPLLKKRPTSCSCGGNEAWFLEAPQTGEYCIRCTCCGPKPNLTEIHACLLKYRPQALDQYELFFRSEEKDVLEEQALIDDHMTLNIEDSIAHGNGVTLGFQKLMLDEIKRLRLELHDFEMMCDHTSQIYDWATDGMISKPQTLPENVISVGEDRINTMIQDELLERTTAVRELLPVLKDMINSPLMIWGGALVKFLCGCIDAALRDLPSGPVKPKWTPNVQNEAQAPKS